LSICLKIEDNIILRGAPYKLISDHTQVHIGNKIVDILCTSHPVHCALLVGSWQSEPHQQQQNPVECHYQMVKKNSTNRVMDRTGGPPETLLLCLQYVCFHLNHTYNMTTGNV
jgi:hypothetical protein